MIDRCGTEARYIIDYYAYEDVDESGEKEMAYNIHARPALSSPGGLITNAKMWLMNKVREKYAISQQKELVRAMQEQQRNA